MAVRHRETLDRIKNSPHWRLVIRPEPYSAERVPHEELLSTIVRHTVRFRGWDFPHLDRNERPEIMTNYIGAAGDFLGHLEYWRFYSSGQFVYLAGVREATEPGWKERLAKTARFRLLVPSADFDWSRVPGFIDVLNFVYVMTEFFEFATRLTQALSDTESVKIEIGLHNIEGFVLTVDDVRRGELHGYYEANESVLEHSWQLRLQELVSATVEATVDAIRWFVVRFGWSEPNVEVIRSDIEDLRERRS